MKKSELQQLAEHYRDFIGEAVRCGSAHAGSLISTRQSGKDDTVISRKVSPFGVAKARKLAKINFENHDQQLKSILYFCS